MAQLEYDTKSITDAVVGRMADCQDPRFKQVMTSLVRHLHDFARDVDLKGDEWFKAIEFLTACGKACDEKRQEFILLSDTLGLSTLVVATVLLLVIVVPGFTLLYVLDQRTMLPEEGTD